MLPHAEYAIVEARQGNVTVALRCVATRRARSGGAGGAIGEVGRADGAVSEAAVSAMSHRSNCHRHPRTGNGIWLAQMYCAA